MPSLLVGNRFPFVPSADRVLGGQLRINLEISASINSSSVGVVLLVVQELDILHAVLAPIVNRGFGSICLQFFEIIYCSNKRTFADTKGRVYELTIERWIDCIERVLTKSKPEVGCDWSVYGIMNKRFRIGVSILQENHSFSFCSIDSCLIRERNKVPKSFLITSEFNVSPEVNVGWA